MGTVGKDGEALVIVFKSVAVMCISPDYYRY